MTAEVDLLCPSCEVAPGNPHGELCTLALCAITGRQRYVCGHRRRGCNTVWTGEYPGLAEAIEYGFYAHLVPGRGWQECAADAPDTMPDLNRLYRECQWDRRRQRMVRRTS